MKEQPQPVPTQVVIQSRSLVLPAVIIGLCILAVPVIFLAIYWLVPALTSVPSGVLPTP